MSGFTGFPTIGLDFLKGLAADNNKAYFDAHRGDFDDALMAPARAFVVAIGERLHRDYSTGILCEPKVNKAIRRMPRDTRFSKDKTPYKTHLDLWFQHGAGRTQTSLFGVTPGFFLRLFHDRVCMGGGTHGFDKPTLAAFRDAVADDATGPALEAAIAEVRAAGDYEIGQPHYKRVPRGFDPEHPRAELLKYNAVWGMAEIPVPPEAHGAEFVDYVHAAYLDCAPLVRWIDAVVERV